jgi:hypothetical protein
MKHAFALILTALLIAPPARAADDAADVDAAGKTVAPAAAAAGEDIPALIKQLGDDSPKVRDEAGAKLRKLGKEALPALADAAKSGDPEVVARSQAVSALIDQDLHPKPAATPRGFEGNRIRLGGNAVAGGNGNVQIFVSSATVRTNSNKRVSVKTTNGVTVKETTVTEDGKTVKIVEDAEGIAVTTTEKKDGKESSETVKAKDKDALKKDNPKAFELFEKHAKGTDVRIDGLNINGGGFGGQIQVGELKLENGNGAVADPEIQKLLDQARERADVARKEAEAARKEAIEQARRALKDAQDEK